MQIGALHEEGTRPWQPRAAPASTASSTACSAASPTLLVLGGIFSFLPVLGIWMLPLGLLLLALDLVFLQGPVNTAVVRGTRKWSTWSRARRDKKARGN